MTVAETPVGAQSSLVGQLQSEIDIVLHPLLNGAIRIALVDYPAHRNVGDSAIWLGELAYLQSLDIRRPVYTCDWLTYSAEELRRHVGDGIILLSGGGNFGDLWQSHQALRERVVQDFPHNPIIQLPQSIHFEEKSRLEKVARLIGSHAQFTLIVRDERSLDLAQARIPSPVHLCPDMAFCLGAISRMRRPSHPILVLSRTDKERAVAEEETVPRGALRTDWREESGDPVLFIQKRMRRLLRSRPTIYEYAGAAAFRLDRFVARRRLNYGRRLLSSGRVVITDRLHAHILCLMMDIPHVVLDNSYGKVSGFMRTWTHGSSVARMAGSISEAVEIARALEKGR